MQNLGQGSARLLDFIFKLVQPLHDLALGLKPGEEWAKPAGIAPPWQILAATVHQAGAG
jgi:hypothetical protein